MQGRQQCYVSLCFANKRLLLALTRPLLTYPRPQRPRCWHSARTQNIAYTKYVLKKPQIPRASKRSTWLLQHLRIRTRPWKSGDFASTAKSMYRWEHTESILISITTNQKASGIKSNRQTRKVAQKTKHWIICVVWTMKARQGVKPAMTARNLTMQQDRHQVSKHIDRLEAMYITFNKKGSGIRRIPHHIHVRIPGSAIWVVPVCFEERGK